LPSFHPSSVEEPANRQAPFFAPVLPPRALLLRRRSDYALPPDGLVSTHTRRLLQNLNTAETTLSLADAMVRVCRQRIRRPMLHSRANCCAWADFADQSPINFLSRRGASTCPVGNLSPWKRSLRGSDGEEKFFERRTKGFSSEIPIELPATQMFFLGGSAQKHGRGFQGRGRGGDTGYQECLGALNGA
jgi:hypothetical protein